jgi:hypothetical protein
MAGIIKPSALGRGYDKDTLGRKYGKHEKKFVDTELERSPMMVSEIPSDRKLPHKTKRDR